MSARWIFGSLAVLLTASGCVEMHGPRPLHPLEIPTSLYSPIATTARTGSLMYENGCLLFRDDQSARVLLPVWPAGSVFNGTSVIFHEPAKADERIVVGEEYLMEGRAVSWSTLPPENYASFRGQCGALPFFVSKIRPAN